MVATFETFEVNETTGADEPIVEFALIASQFKPFEIDPNVFVTPPPQQQGGGS